MSTLQLKVAVLVCAFFIINTITVYADQQKYEIRSAEFFSEGRTLPYFLEKAAEIEIGKQFESQEKLIEYVKDREQHLLNQRVLSSVTISTETGDVFEGIIPVDLKIETVDTWNLIALPYFRYDSNTGFLLSLRARDYNFFGTMETLGINLNWTIDQNNNNTLGADVNFVYPFYSSGFNWLWSVNSAINILNTGTNFNLGTGLTMYIPSSIGNISVSANQGFNIVGNETAYAKAGDGLYFTEGVSSSLAVPLYKSSTIGNLNWTPSISYGLIWDFDGISTANLGDPYFVLGQSLSYGRVDWIENFRKGFSLSLNNSNTWKIFKNTWDRTILFSASGYLADTWIGLSSRLSGFTRFDSENGNSGTSIRGVLDNRVIANTGCFLNIDLPIRVIQFAPSDWFGKRWMRFFNFEQQWSPFLDLAYTYQNAGSLGNIWYAAGLEVITFPRIMRSFYIRISAGWDIKEVLRLKSLSGLTKDGRGINELFFGLGHFY